MTLEVKASVRPLFRIAAATPPFREAVAALIYPGWQVSIASRDNCLPPDASVVAANHTMHLPIESRIATHYSTLNPASEMTMRVRIVILHERHAVTDRLHSDGWRRESVEPESLWLCPHSIQREFEARVRLQDLGLLTSSAVRIEFPIAQRG